MPTAIPGMFPKQPLDEQAASTDSWPTAWLLEEGWPGK